MSIEQVIIDAGGPIQTVNLNQGPQGPAGPNGAFIFNAIADANTTVDPAGSTIWTELGTAPETRTDYKMLVSFPRIMDSGGTATGTIRADLCKVASGATTATINDAYLDTNFATITQANTTATISAEGSQLITVGGSVEAEANDFFFIRTYISVSDALIKGCYAWLQV